MHADPKSLESARSCATGLPAMSGSRSVILVADAGRAKTRSCYHRGPGREKKEAILDDGVMGVQQPDEEGDTKLIDPGVYDEDAAGRLWAISLGLCAM